MNRFAARRMRLQLDGVEHLTRQRPEIRFKTPRRAVRFIPGNGIPRS